MENFYLYLGVIFVGIIMISRAFARRSNDLITAEQQELLLNEFAKVKKYSLIPLIFIVVMILLSYRFFEEYKNILMFIYSGILLLYVTILNTYIYQKLKKIGMSKKYLNNFLISRILPYLSILILLVIVGLQLVAQI